MFVCLNNWIGGNTVSMQELLMDVLHDSVPMIPFLFLTYLLLEYLEHHESYEYQRKLLSWKRFAPMFGAVLGIVPQCGFSVIASGLFVDGAISMGTLLAVFISTSDEAIPILIAHPDHAQLLPQVIMVKFFLAIFVGYLTDFLLRAHYHNGNEELKVERCSCEDDHGSILHNAISRTLRIFLFVFVVDLLLSGLITFIGEDRLSTLLLDQSFLQPFFAALIGFIPNCAASVILAQLYVSSVISFGSLIAGLVSSAGLGLMVLLKVDKQKKEVFLILGSLFLTAFLFGSLLQFF